MSRAIKFRAWDKEKQKMVSSYYGSCYSQSVDILALYAVHPDMDAWRDRFIVEQFTGMRDRDARDIYEGDILRHPDNLKSAFEVTFEYGSFGLKGIIGWSNWHSFATASAAIEGCTIIGNIHENPELLQ